MLHGFNSGTDSRVGWVRMLYVACGVGRCRVGRSARRPRAPPRSRRRCPWRWPDERRRAGRARHRRGLDDRQRHGCSPDSTAHEALDHARTSRCTARCPVSTSSDCSHFSTRRAWPAAAGPGSRSRPSCARCAAPARPSSSTAARASRPAARTAPCCAARRISCSTAHSRSQPRCTRAQLIVAVHDAPRQTRSSTRSANAATRGGCGSTSPGRFVAGEARALLRVLAGGPALPPGRRRCPPATATSCRTSRRSRRPRCSSAPGPRGFAETGNAGGAGHRAAHRRRGRGPSRRRRGAARHAARHRPARRAAPTTPLSSSPAATTAPGCGPTRTLPVSRAGLAAAGGALGAGVLLALDRRPARSANLTRVSRWLAAQSAGQCGPCRFGLPALAADVAAAAHGNPPP